MKKFLIFLVLFITIAITYLRINSQKLLKDNTVLVDDNKTVCEKELEIESNNILVEKFDGVVKPVDFNTLPEAKTFYTSITEDVDLGPNFTGHFRVSYWGCGTDCYGFAVVDSNSGKIISFSPVNESYHLRTDYDLNSTLLILDPVYAGQERKYFSIVKDKDGNITLELVCSEVSNQNMYNEPE